MDSFRLAILSDLHAAPKSIEHKAGEVKLYCDQDHAAPASHPIRGLKELIEKSGLRADAVVCPGDMANRADAAALSYVWKSLHELRDLLRARGVIATVGNHDVDSRNRSVNSFPRESLMRLDPPFPANDRHVSDHYWAHGFCFQQIGKTRFLVINTCWLHEARDELERGVVTDYTLERIRQQLEGGTEAELNIAVFHHHPHPHTDLNLGYDDIIRNGQRLLDMLADYDQWMVVHGHKHHPKIEYAQGQYRQPIVLACGSFSGRIEGDNALVSKNYFHLVEICRKNSRIAGEIVSWNWVPGLGWKDYASSPPSFPSRVGFGSSLSVEQLALGVASFVGTRPAVDWDSVLGNEPDLRFVMPKELDALRRLLERDHGIQVLCNDNGLIRQVGLGLDHD